jgi:hypothetical protein
MACVGRHMRSEEASGERRPAKGDDWPHPKRGVLDHGQREVVIAAHNTCIRELLRESVLFIGTQFSNLYTAVDTPAKGRVGQEVVCTGKAD